MIYNWPVNKKKGETWVFNEIIPILDTYSCNFISNNQSFNLIKYGTSSGHVNNLFYGTTIVATGVGKTEGGLQIDTWKNQAYRTVTFLEPPTGDLLTWLQQNGVKQ